MAHGTRLGRLMRLIYVLAYYALAAAASPILTGRDVLCHEGARICGHQILERGKMSRGVSELGQNRLGSRCIQGYANVSETCRSRVGI